MEVCKLSYGNRIFPSRGEKVKTGLSEVSGEAGHA